MKIEQVVPILNVSDVEASFAWFAKLGWSKQFEWDADDPAAPPGFGGVSCDGRELFLCRDGQGSRGRGANIQTGGREPTSGRTREHGCPSGSTTSTRFTIGAWPSSWRSRIPRPTSRGVSARCTCATPTVMSSAMAVRSARLADPRSPRAA